MIKFTAMCPHCEKETVVIVREDLDGSTSDTVSLEDLCFSLDGETVCEHCEEEFEINLEIQ